jgi:uncharacterized protein YuzE
MKKKNQFRVDVQVDKNTGRVAAVYFYIRSGNSVETREYADGNALADYDRRGQLLGVELLGPCKVTILDRISRDEPKPIREFLRGSVPHQLAIA